MEGTKIPVASLTEEEAAGYAEEMKQAFMDHWKTSCEKQKRR
jgi:hypothetical protein